MTNIYKAPDSDVNENNEQVLVGYMRPGKAVLFAPLATPVLWALVVAPILIISNGFSNSGLLAVMALAFVFPVVVSYGIILLLGAPIYFLFIHFGWVRFFVFNSGSIFSAVVCVGIFSLVDKGGDFFLVVIPLFLFAFFNSCLMWYLMYKPTKQ